MELVCLILFLLLHIPTLFTYGENSEDPTSDETREEARINAGEVGNAERI